jgi:hypothetical protein
MADPRAFISFDADNNRIERLLFCGQTKLSTIPFKVQDWSSKDVLPQKTWKQTIETKISACNMLIVLVGKKTSSASGVCAEISMATLNNVPIFGVYVDDAGSFTPLPVGLRRTRTIRWTWQGVGSAIRQMMTEGKNKRRISTGLN